MQILGGIILIFVMGCLLYWINKSGIISLMNYGRIGFIVWGISIGLYNLKLCDLYKPSLSINIVSFFIMIQFLFFSKCLNVSSKNILQAFTDLEKPSNNYSFAVFLTLLLSILSFTVNYRAGNLRLFSHNSYRENFSLGYFLHLATIIAIYFWIRARQCVGIKKIKNFFLMAFSLFLIMSDMSRSPLILFLTGVVIYEISKYIKKKRTINKNIIIIFFVVLILAIWLFGYVGDKRSSAVLEGDVLSFYKININMPGGLAWTYIYLTSPIENTRNVLDGNFTIDYSLGNNLLYPWIKLLSNVVGLGSDYSDFFHSFEKLPLLLNKDYGLNAASFVYAAMLDFDLAGIIIYMIFYGLIGWFWKRIILSFRLSNYSKIIISSLLFQIPLYSVFSNSLFGIAFIWVNIFFVLCWDYCGRFRNQIKF